MTQDMDKQPTPEELRAEITRRQENLAHTVDQLAARANPRALVDQGKSQARNAVKGVVFTEEGELRIERIAVMAGAIIVLIGLSIWNRSRRA